MEGKLAILILIKEIDDKGISPSFKLIQIINFFHSHPSHSEKLNFYIIELFRNNKQAYSSD